MKAWITVTLITESDIMKQAKIFVVAPFILTLIRLLLGWLFLYEGISKLVIDSWSSAGYLLQSHWVLSGMFHWIAQNPNILEIVDLLNIWGLICIGLSLMLGFFARTASICGILLLSLYFIANPPLVGYIGESSGEGHYLWVNKNVLLIAILALIALIPKGYFYGIDRLIRRLFENRNKTTDSLNQTHGRRELLKDLISLPVLGGFAYALYSKKRWESFEERNLIGKPSRVDATTGATSSIKTVGYKAGKEAPKGKIGDLEISRLICGGNLISGYAHSRDLIYVSSLVQAYFNDDKVIETLRLCEACGINTIIIRVDHNTLRIMEKYRKRGGKMQWFAQCKITDEDVRSDVDAAVDVGAKAAFISGGICDWIVNEGDIDLMGKTIDYIKSQNILAGVAAHDLKVVMACENHGIDVDFYKKTLNSGNYWTAGPKLISDMDWKPDPYKVVEPEFGKGTHDNIWSITPQQTIEVMKNVTKPWIAFKVLGAGAIAPQQGLRYAFENGADFACVGMFDFQIAENANIVNDLMAENLGRQRNWMT